MAPPPARERSSTSTSAASNRPRPISRASTTSLNTHGAQSVQQYRHASESTNLPLSQKSYPHPLHYTTDSAIRRSEQHVVTPDAGYIIDPSLQYPATGARAMSVDHVYNSQHEDTRPSINHQYAFEPKESQFRTTFNDEQNQEDTGTGDLKKKKGSASSIANDQELRKLFRENHHRDLKEIAAEVLANERGPRSEKTKQIFAMNWLNTICVRDSGSVTRVKVFLNYATRCGTERVPPLNPASFGKLVRIIFPGIQTRRLGQRGESKYHYVDLALIDEQPEVHRAEQDHDAESTVTSGEVLAKRRSQVPADTAIFPSPDLPVDFKPAAETIENATSSSHLYLDNATERLHQDCSGSNMVRRNLKFPTQQEPPYAHNEPIELPSLTDFLPEGTDADASDALIALYRTHCISVIDCFRFCKERMFWHHFTSFHGTLTVPVQRLLAHPRVAAWIKECDWLMYQKMIRFVSPLALQVMPVKVIDTFRNISDKLICHISHIFHNHSPHVRDAKIGPASIFVGLIDRLLRVNATAHAAANMLTNDANRDQMWHDWICFVKPTGVVESSLPCCGYTRTMRILLLEVGELLGPLRSMSYQGIQPVFANAQADPGPNYQPLIHHDLDDSSTSGVLDRWTTFLHDLPSRFPEVDARTLIWCVGEVSSACIRDITMAQALSFGSWWVTKVWVDEMLRWIAEKGGFLESGSSSMDMRPQKRTATEAGFDKDDHIEAHGVSRPRTAVSDSTDVPGHRESVELEDSFEHQRTRFANHHQQETYDQTSEEQRNESSKIDMAASTDSRLPSQLAKEVDLNEMQGQDDSGIGMDLELPQNTPIRLADYGGFVTRNANGGSDPADVVVC